MKVHQHALSGNINDSLLFEEQIKGINLEKVMVLADCGYSTYEIIEKIWSYDKEVYKSRNKIERFFHYLKDSRRIATRYEKLDENYTSLIYFSSIICWQK